MTQSWLRIAGLCGILSPVVALSLIFLAISYSPWFSWTENALSDLGVGNAAMIFNSGLILGGVLSMVFAIGLLESMRKQRLGFAGAFLLLLGAISLMATGAFPESAGRIHFCISVAFFALEPIALLLCGAALSQRSSEKYLGFFTILIAALAAGVWTLWFWAPPCKGVAIPEFLFSLALSSWSIVFGIRFPQANTCV